MHSKIYSQQGIAMINSGLFMHRIKMYLKTKYRISNLYASKRRYELSINMKEYFDLPLNTRKVSRINAVISNWFYKFNFLHLYFGLSSMNLLFQSGF